MKKATGVFLWVMIMTAWVGAQGPLTPPGAPAPTMKSLDEIEARTPITNLPYVITQSGSYYVTGNLTCSAPSNGIEVGSSVNSAVIDLNGFTLTGPGAVGGSGIYAEGKTNQLVVRNGCIRNWRGYGAYGVRTENIKSTHVYDVRVQNCENGIKAYRGVVENCEVSDCSRTEGNCFGILGTGVIAVNCIVRKVVAENGTVYGFSMGYGSIVRDCVADSISGVAGGYGFQGQNGTIIESCVARKCFDGIYSYDRSVLRNNLAVDNENNGIVLGYGGGRAEGNNVAYNGYLGLYCTQSNNLILANSFSMNSNGNYLVTRGSYGPFTSVTGTTTVVTNHPWANFSY